MRHKPEGGRRRWGASDRNRWGGSWPGGGPAAAVSRQIGGGSSASSGGGGGSPSSGAASNPSVSLATVVCVTGPAHRAASAGRQRAAACRPSDDGQKAQPRHLRRRRQQWKQERAVPRGSSSGSGRVNAPPRAAVRPPAVRRPAAAAVPAAAACTRPASASGESGGSTMPRRARSPTWRSARR